MTMHLTDHVDPRPQFALNASCFAHSRQRWFHYAPGRGPWVDGHDTESFRAPADLLVRWLAEQGPRYEMELRIGTTGGHAGVWLGLTGVGATPRQAEYYANEGSKGLKSAMAAYRWNNRAAKAPRLPHKRIGLVTTEGSRRLRSSPHDFLFLPILGRVALPSYPLVLQVQARFEQGRPELVREAGRTRELAMSRCDHDGEEHRHQDQGEGIRLAWRAERILEEASGLQLCLALCGRKLPADLPLRLLAAGLTQDLQASLCWKTKPVWIPSELAILRNLIHLMSASAESPKKSRDDLPF